MPCIVINRNSLAASVLLGLWFFHSLVVFIYQLLYGNNNHYFLHFSSIISLLLLLYGNLAHWKSQIKHILIFIRVQRSITILNAMLTIFIFNLHDFKTVYRQRYDFIGDGHFTSLWTMTMIMSNITLLVDTIIKQIVMNTIFMDTIPHTNGNEQTNSRLNNKL
ncbi:hypothetical protein BC833DRAFT_597856 [Globomyces pollinis-pini]|nr:hypothetical protein BC833DRAFT_597856 [Globomyces pollinis-pini]